MKIYKTPALNEPSERAADFFNALCTTHLDSVSYLFNRWQDEQEYEDINDYKPRFDKHAEEFGVTITKMSSRPFGFIFTVDNRTYTFTISSKGALGFKRIK
jgi:hypothetical protein